jgi:hypothetical protein
MNTSGHGNDGLMILMVVGITLAIGVLLFGGPVEALEATNDLIGQLVWFARDFVSGLF